MRLNLNKIMNCNLCPNKCNIDRTTKKGECGVGENLRIAKFYLHPFEEPFISGEKGSGTIFFCGCSLKCVFCQNYELSRNLRGKDITVNELAKIFEHLQDMGANNINLVSPTHYVDKIISALKIFKPKIPVVYNTHGYERPQTIKTLFDYVDVFLPDLKFFSPQLSLRYTGKKDYFEVASKAVKLMAEKPLIFDKNGMMLSGTVVRHLVLPQGIIDSKKILDWFIKNLNGKVYFNLMSQYTPFGDIKNFPELNRSLTKREYDRILDYANSLGIENLLYQEMQSANEKYIPNWDF